MQNNATHRKPQARKQPQFMLAVVTRTDAGHVVLGLLDDEELLRVALARMVDHAAFAAGNSGDPIMLRAHLAKVRVFKEVLSAL